MRCTIDMIIDRAELSCASESAGLNYMRCTIDMIIDRTYCFTIADNSTHLIVSNFLTFQGMALAQQ